MTFDPMSVEVTCVTLPKDHCVQVPWQYINVCGYSDQFCKIPHTYTYIHTHTTYRMSDHIVSYWTQFRLDKNMLSAKITHPSCMTTRMATTHIALHSGLKETRLPLLNSLGGAEQCILHYWYADKVFKRCAKLRPWLRSLRGQPPIAFHRVMYKACILNFNFFGLSSIATKKWHLSHYIPPPLPYYIPFQLYFIHSYLLLKLWDKVFNEFFAWWGVPFQYSNQTLISLVPLLITIYIPYNHTCCSNFETRKFSMSSLLDEECLSSIATRLWYSLHSICSMVRPLPSPWNNSARI